MRTVVVAGAMAPGVTTPPITAPNVFTFETAPLELRFESSSVIADADGRGAVGTPEVCCEQ